VVVDTLLGLVGILLFIVGIISLAGAVTWTVVRLTPSKKAEETNQRG
jgi:hypothetical protein